MIFELKTKYQQKYPNVYLYLCRKESPHQLSGVIWGIQIKSPQKKSTRKIPLNAVEREPVPIRVLNPNASEASFKSKQRSYRKTKLN